MTTSEQTQTTTVLHELYAAFARGDIPAVLAGFDPHRARPTSQVHAQKNTGTYCYLRIEPGEHRGHVAAGERGIELAQDGPGLGLLADGHGGLLCRLRGASARSGPRRRAIGYVTSVRPLRT